ncbi:MAG: YicC family protein [Butyrivibrio sp.]|nr:YicC family protein [Butyrivibrio sp.]
MVSSMTGFGRSEVTEGQRRYTVELKSVNNRYLDLNIKMPKVFNALEANIRSELKQYMKRGKVDVYITYEDLTESGSRVQYNKGIAEEYMECLKQMSDDFHLENDIRLSALSRFPEVLTTEDEEIDEASLWEPLQKAIRMAGEQFAKARLREGEFLKTDLIQKLDGMLANVDFITERSPVIVEEYRQNLRNKVKELLEDTQIDEGRLLMEVTIYADKVCVDEELVRLRSHISAVRQALETGDDQNGIGRKLDFLAQEMNREANTTLSKTSDLEISNRAIDLKTDVEKVREQIQNIE